MNIKIVEETANLLDKLLNQIERIRYCNWREDKKSNGTILEKVKLNVVKIDELLMDGERIENKLRSWIIKNKKTVEQSEKLLLKKLQSKYGKV